MSLTERLLEVANLGAEWVLWVLVVLSVCSIGVMIERAYFFLTHRARVGALQTRLAQLLGRAEFDRAARELAAIDTMETQVVSAGLAEHQLGATAAGELMAGALSAQRQRYERFLTFLATLGANAPFIGLFGTVLGTVKALASYRAGAVDETALVAIIGEALIATGVGLLVAIPAVIAFNAFKTQVKARMASTEQLTHTLLAYLSAEGAPRRRDLLPGSPSEAIEAGADAPMPEPGATRQVIG